MRKTYLIFAILSSGLCLFSGLWILTQSNWSDNDVLSIGIGFYFVGKAFFVGPMLILTALK